MEAVAVATEYVPEPAERVGAPAWLASLRQRAFERFERLGFPTPKNEAWRYTGVQLITGVAWAEGRSASATIRNKPEGLRLRQLAEIPEAELAPHFARIAD